MSYKLLKVCKTAATSCHEMGSEWSDCCSSLIAFVQVSKKPPEAHPCEAFLACKRTDTNAGHVHARRRAAAVTLRPLAAHVPSAHLSIEEVQSRIAEPESKSALSTIVHLYCMSVKAMAMEEIAHLQQGNFPLIDIEGLNQKEFAEL
eukprot:5892086-Amphidinium_carterae.1